MQELTNVNIRQSNLTEKAWRNRVRRCRDVGRSSRTFHQIDIRYGTERDRLCNEPPVYSAVSEEGRLHNLIGLRIDQ